MARRGGLCLRFHPKIGKFGTFTIVQKNKNEKKWIFFSLKGLSSKYVKMWFCYFSGKFNFCTFCTVVHFGVFSMVYGYIQYCIYKFNFFRKREKFWVYTQQFCMFFNYHFFRFVKTNQHLLLYWFNKYMGAAWCELYCLTIRF